jgi:methionyl-tRNA formyltransferase
MRVAFFGSSRFSCLVLDALLHSAHEIAVIVTQPDQPAGRKLELAPTAVCCNAMQLGVPVLKPPRLRHNAAFRAELSAFRPDALLVASYGQIIPEKVLRLAEWPLNVHPSRLPELRGASPIRSALLQGLAETGCCIIYMTPRMDDGDILLQQPLAVPGAWNHHELESALGGLGGRLAVQALDQAAEGTLAFTPQDAAQATFCTTSTRADTCINWNRAAADLHNFIRAWDPDLGALTLLPDGRRLKIWAAEEHPTPADAPSLSRSILPGEIIALNKRHIWVATASGSLRLDEVQPENKPRMPVASFLAGNRLRAGEVLTAPSPALNCNSGP